MGEWLLILCAFSQGVSCTQVGPFLSQAACETAGKAADKKIPSIFYLCAARDLAAAATPPSK